MRRKKAPANRKTTTIAPPCVSPAKKPSAKTRRPARISRLLKLLMVLSVVKIAVFAGIGFEAFDSVAHLLAGLGLSGMDRPANAQQAAPPPPPPPPVDLASAQASAPQTPASAENRSADWQALKAKEEDLARRENALKSLEAGVDAKLQRLTALEGRIQAMLDDAQVMRDDKMKHLIDVYSNMKASQAAQALEQLDLTTAVKILSGMRGRQAGEILNFVAPQKAAVLSQALTEMQVPFQR